jgi:RNA polymerase sigma-70 factor (ECF subfamily)
MAEPNPAELDAEPLPLDEAEWFAAARAGSAEALGRLLELCRRYLLQVANGEMDPVLQTKVGASDLVQETFIEAQRAFGRFQGDNAKELRAWLRAILLNRVAMCSRRYYGSAKREIGKEVGINPDSERQTEFAAAGPTPSRVLMQEERAAALTAAIERLPAHYRQIVVWRQLENLSFEEIAARLDRSLDAVRKLWWRAIQQLHVEIGDSL